MDVEGRGRRTAETEVRRRKGGRHGVKGSRTCLRLKRTVSMLLTHRDLIATLAAGLTSLYRLLELTPLPYRPRCSPNPRSPPGPRMWTQNLG